MRPFDQIAGLAIFHPSFGPADPASGGMFLYRTVTADLAVIASWADGWDHVSVSLPDRCPTWSEMDAVKRRFFLPHEVVMQIHPAEVDHMSIHPYCLHLWRPHDAAIPLPPKWMVA